MFNVVFRDKIFNKYSVIFRVRKLIYEWLFKNKLSQEEEENDYKKNLF